MVDGEVRRSGCVWLGTCWVVERSQLYVAEERLADEMSRYAGSVKCMDESTEVTCGRVGCVMI